MLILLLIFCCCCMYCYFCSNSCFLMLVTRLFLDFQTCKKHSTFELQPFPLTSTCIIDNLVLCITTKFKWHWIDDCSWSQNGWCMLNAEDCRYRVWDSFGRQLYSSAVHDYPITRSVHLLSKHDLWRRGRLWFQYEVTQTSLVWKNGRHKIWWPNITNKYKLQIRFKAIFRLYI